LRWSDNGKITGNQDQDSAAGFIDQIIENISQTLRYSRDLISNHYRAYFGIGKEIADQRQLNLHGVFQRMIIQIHVLIGMRAEQPVQIMIQ
jgi:hypothetical protein